MNIIKQKAISLFENALAKSGTILSVREWDPATFFEIDVHFPNLDMSGWTKVQHIKVKVANGIYRDYTPAGWDADIRTCTLYIDAVQDGPGSNWVKSLKQGDEITYIGVGSTLHKPVEDNEMIVLGDMSCIGHYLALQQLAGDKLLRGAIAIAEESHCNEFYQYFKWKVQPVLQSDSGGFNSLMQWTLDKNLSDSAIYISGHIPTCVQLRKELKKRKDQPYGIRAQGFWK